MFILGIKCSGHDTGACIIHDSGIRLSVIAISEERLNRSKHTYTFPLKSIKYCLGYFGLENLNDLDALIVDYHTGDMFIDNYKIKYSIPHSDFDPIRNFSIFKSLKIDKSKINFVNHLDAHAASSFFSSSFDRSAVVVVDRGVGIYLGNHNKIMPIHRMGYGSTIFNKEVTNIPWTLGTGALYQEITKKLSLGSFGAGKTMALASYNRLYPMIDRIDINPKITNDVFFDYRSIINKLMSGEFISSTFDQKIDNYLDKNYINLAFVGQKRLEQDMEYLVTKAMTETESKNLSLAGGVALSCVGNRSIFDNTKCENIFVQPASSDEGIPLGCALLGYNKLNGTRRFYMSDAYMGIPYDQKDLLSLFKELGFTYTKVQPLDVAKLISKGKIIGRFFGRSEYGPRALGNRSILADPRRIEMINIINSSIKHREGFRPFAPSCLADKVNDYFDLPIDSRFMTIAATVKIGMRNKIPAVVHVDGTTRPQLVHNESNMEYYELIKCFGDITGIYCLLNTSFNDNGEPIVETYENAIKTFMNIDLDYLYIEGYLIEKQNIKGIRLDEIKNCDDVGYDELINRFCDYDLYRKTYSSCN